MLLADTWILSLKKTKFDLTSERSCTSKLGCGAAADVKIISFRISTAEPRQCKIASATIVCQLVLRNSFLRGQCWNTTWNPRLGMWHPIKPAATSQVPNQTLRLHSSYVLLVLFTSKWLYPVTLCTSNPHMEGWKASSPNFWRWGHTNYSIFSPRRAQSEHAVIFFYVSFTPICTVSLNPLFSIHSRSIFFM